MANTKISALTLKSVPVADDVMVIVDSVGGANKKVRLGNFLMYPVAENDIGVMGGPGAGVGICPAASLPTGMTPLTGYTDPTSANYGNYIYTDGSAMVWVPKFYYQIGNGGYELLTLDVAPGGAGWVVGNTLTGATSLKTCVIVQVINPLNYIVKERTGAFTLDESISNGTDAANQGAAYPVFGAANSFPVNWVDIKPASAYANTAAANTAGYALHRAFIDGGAEKPGFFMDKYPNSKNPLGSGYVGSSIKNGLPLSTASTHNPMYSATPGVGLTACTANDYSQSINAAHARDGVDGAINPASVFHIASRFQFAALALLSMAHGQAAKCEAWCAWYDWTGAKNYPKGCNNNALRDTDDTTVAYVTDGYSNCGKAGSGFPFAKTTHNGQDCGVADLNGLMYEVSLGMTCIAASKTIVGATAANPCVVEVTGHGYATGDVIMITAVVGMTQLNDKLFTITLDGGDPNNKFSLDGVNSSAYTPFTSGASSCTKATGFYVAKQATAMKSFTPGNSAATDHWGATGVAAMMDAFTPVFVTAGGGACAQRFGNAFNQVLSGAVSGAKWLLSGLGLPFAATGLSTGGDNLFGKDYFYQYIRNELCPLSCGDWDNTSSAGAWCLSWNGYRAGSGDGVGWRCATYPA
jgi:hypothetical protein